MCPGNAMMSPVFRDCVCGRGHLGGQPFSSRGLPEWQIFLVLLFSCACPFSLEAESGDQTLLANVRFTTFLRAHHTWTCVWPVTAASGRAWLPSGQTDSQVGAARPK